MTGDLQQAGLPLYVREEGRTVTVRKVFTGTGERLELAAQGLDERIRLDAIALESVAWQDPADLSRRAARMDHTPVAAPRPEGPERDDPIRLRNEFADATVEKVESEGRQLLAIAAPKLGYEIRLGLPELEWLTTQSHDRFTEWLERPFGPDADEEH